MFSSSKTKMIIAETGWLAFGRFPSTPAPDYEEMVNARATLPPGGCSKIM
jgi:hypothetical protein